MEANIEKKAKVNRPLAALFKIDDFLGFVEKHVATLLFIAMIFFMVFQVTARFILQFPAPWTEELSRYLWIGVGFIGTAVALKNHQHIEINLIIPIIDKIKGARNKAIFVKCIDLIRFTVILVFCVYMTRLCFDFTLRVIQMQQLTPALQMPKWWIDAVICFGWAAMAFHSVIIIIKTIITPISETGGEEA